MTKLSKLLKGAALAIALTASAAAQTTTQMPTTPGPASGSTAATGTVVDPSNKPQAGVPVQIVGPPGQTVAITDKSGNWSVYNLPAGNYKVKALSADNPTETKTVTFSVKEPSFWSKFVGSSNAKVKSPLITLEASAR